MLLLKNITFLKQIMKQTTHDERRKRREIP